TTASSTSDAAPHTPARSHLCPRRARIHPHLSLLGPLRTVLFVLYGKAEFLLDRRPDCPGHCCWLVKVSGLREEEIRRQRSNHPPIGHWGRLRGDWVSLGGAERWQESAQRGRGRDLLLR